MGILWILSGGRWGRPPRAFVELILGVMQQVEEIEAEPEATAPAAASEPPEWCIVCERWRHETGCVTRTHSRPCSACGRPTNHLPCPACGEVAA